jgi:FAD/FMN-containing dehydrogenase
VIEHDVMDWWTLPDRAVWALIERLIGTVVRPHDVEYDRARRIWNSALDRRRALIVRPADADDIVQTIRFARTHDLPLAVRSGGHSLAGHGAVDGAMVLDLSGVNRLAIDPDRRIAWAQPGLTWGEYSTHAQTFGLATPAGDVASVGVAGLTLGGGIGWLARKHGLTIDSLLSVDVVTADGRQLTASAEEHPDLFWALRGGGGNFGVVTGFRFELHPVGTILGGAIVYPATADLLRAYVDAATAAPDELSTITFVLQAPPLPFIPAEAHGTPVVLITACYAGELNAGQQAMAPLRRLAGVTPLADTTGPMPYPALYDLTEPGAKPGPAAGRAGFLQALDDATIEAILVYCNQATSPLSVAELRVLGGAMARVPADATAFAHRDKPLFFAILNHWDDKIDPRPERHVAWVEAFWRAVADRTDGAYVNFLGDEGEDRVRVAYPPATYARLAEIKRRYDPDNLFRLNQNIRPA